MLRPVTFSESLPSDVGKASGVFVRVFQRLTLYCHNEHADDLAVGCLNAGHVEILGKPRKTFGLGFGDIAYNHEVHGPQCFKIVGKESMGSRNKRDKYCDCKRHKPGSS